MLSLAVPILIWMLLPILETAAVMKEHESQVSEAGINIFITP